jgi:LPS-assembly protein
VTRERKKKKPCCIGLGRSLRPILCLTVVALLAAVSGTSFAQPTPAREHGPVSKKKSGILPTDIPIEMSAEKLDFDYDKGIYIARGNVTLRQGNLHLSTDNLIYELKTGKLTARGKVIARTDGGVVEADEFSVILPKAVGVLVNGKLFLNRENIYLTGARLEKTGDSSYRIRQGSFTTCMGAVPDWRITGRDLNVTVEGYGVLKHGFFYVKDIPVFYLPWLIYPAKRTRQSGLLMPNMSNSTLRGFDLRIPLFVALSPSADLTIVPRICTKRAAQASLEFRYIPSRDLRGRFYGEYTYDWKYAPEDHPKYHRYYLNLHHMQDIGGLLKFKAEGTLVSDRDYFELWGSRFDRRKRVRYLESNAVLYRQWDNLLFQAEARHFDNLDVADNAVTVQNLPIVTGTLFYQQLPYTPFYFSSDLVYNNFYAPYMDDRWLGSRLQTDVRLSLPISFGRYLKMQPSVTYMGKAYAADYYENDRSVLSFYGVRSDLYQLDGEVFTDINAVYDGPYMGFQRLKHTIRPRLSWRYRPPTHQENYPYFDESDRVAGVSMVTAELRQTLTGRLGHRRYLDFMTLRVSQGYDLSRLSRHAKEFGNEPGDWLKGWTNTHAEFSLRPHTLLDLVGQTEYDPVANRVRKYSFSIGLMDHRGDMVRVFHSFAEGDKRQDLNRQTNLNVQLKLASALDCFFENQYTHQFDFSYFTSFGLVYHPQCWNIELKYSESRSQDPLTKRIKEPDQTVFMTISLYGLGQVYRMTRDWGDFLSAPLGSIETAPD